MVTKNKKIRYFIQLGVGDLFFDSALPDSEIPNSQLVTLSATEDLISPIGGNMLYWGYFLSVV